MLGNMKPFDTVTIDPIFGRMVSYDTARQDFIVRVNGPLDSLPRLAVVLYLQKYKIFSAKFRTIDILRH
jgi:hypothetical protein